MSVDPFSLENKTAVAIGGTGVLGGGNAASSFVTGVDLRVDGGFLCQTI